MTDQVPCSEECADNASYAELAAKVDRLYEAVKTHNEWMQWGKDEITKALQALGPVLSMAAPMLAAAQAQAAQEQAPQAPAAPVATPGGPVFVPPTSTPPTE